MSITDRILALILLFAMSLCPSFTANNKTRTEIDAVFFVTNHGYLFQGDQYYRFTGSTMLPEYPKKLTQWPGMPAEFTSGVDAALYHPRRKRTYLFKGSQYIRLSGITVETKTPQPITNWKNLPAGFQSGIDAAVARGEYIYFFKGGKYVRLKDISVQSGYPADIRPNWDMPEDYQSGGLSAVLNHRQRNKLYAFQGSTYIRMSDTKTDGGYPKSIIEWQGLVENTVTLDLSQPFLALNNMEYRGNTLKTMATGGGAGDCNTQCQNTENCSGFTYTPPAQCSLRSGPLTSTRKTGAISGLMDSFAYTPADITVRNYKRMPNKSGCYDLCMFDPKTGVTTFKEAAGKDLEIVDRKNQTVKTTDEVCYMEITIK